MALTQLEIKNAKPAKNSVGKYADGNGLYLFVQPNLTKTWVFRYTLGKRRDMGLGSIDNLSAIDARQKALELKQMVAKGIDPIDAKIQVIAQRADEKKTTIITFEQAAKEYIDLNRSSWKNEKHIQQWENTLTTYVYSIFKDTPINEIGVSHVVKVLAPIWADIPESANRIRGRIETILYYAKGVGYRTGENPATWKGNLEFILPAKNRTKRIKPQPALPYENIQEFMAELRARTGIASRALELAILTAMRSGAVRLATWSEFDLEKKIWDIPADHMKGKIAFRAALSNAAIAMLKVVPRMVGTNLVFPSPRDELKSLSDNTLKKVIELINMERVEKGLPAWKDPKQDREIVPHGFRSTFRDWGSETTSYPHEMQEIALAHAQGDKTEAAYRRGDMLIKRQQMMEDWAQYCEPKNANVVSINKAVK